MLADCSHHEKRIIYELVKAVACWYNGFIEKRFNVLSFFPIVHKAENTEIVGCSINDENEAQSK